MMKIQLKKKRRNYRGGLFGFGIFPNNSKISFFSSYPFHNSNKLTIARAISCTLSISTFNSANHAFNSFCNITHAICKQPIAICK